MSVAPSDIERAAWPLARLGEAMEALARASGMPVRPVELGCPVPPGSEEALGRWLEGVGACLGLEIEPVEAPYLEAEQLLRGAAPCLLLLQYSDGRQPGFLALLGRRGKRVVLLDPQRSRRCVGLELVRAAFCQRLEGAFVGETSRLLERAGVPSSRQPRAMRAILRERLRAARIGHCWLLRLPPGASFWSQVAYARLPRRLLTFLIAHLAGYLLLLVSWIVIGKAALAGRIDTQWLIAWLLVLLTQVPLSAVASWSQGIFAIGIGGLLKLRLLEGALRLEPEEIRSEGAGRLLGRVIESGAVESLALSAGFSGLLAVVELLGASAVLLIGPGGMMRLLLFLGCIAATVLIGFGYYRRRLTWTDARLEMTNDLVERMVGHRTRLAQEPGESWHQGEDRLLASYVEESVALDRSHVRFGVLLSRGWMLLGLAGLIPPVVIASSGGPVVVAIALGGVLLAARALGTLAASLASLTGAAVAWQQVGPLFRAAARGEPVGAPDVLLELEPGAGLPKAQGAAPVLEASEICFRYRPSGALVLSGCNLQIREGERLLLEGPSGSGKTTLASLLVGLRQPDAGLLLLRGLDRQTLGAQGWRRQVVGAPQFHENHVFTATFAFNLLMGRSWPADSEELQQAEELCRELGLGPLLERMPAGLMQVVGETGWRLSHGERSRLFMARALLQRAELVVLDESFAALDPASLRQCLETVLRRAPALLVIAHP